MLQKQNVVSRDCTWKYLSYIPVKYRTAFFELCSAVISSVSSFSYTLNLDFCVA